jgi:hypothetical protein
MITELTWVLVLMLVIYGFLFGVGFTLAGLIVNWLWNKARS